MSRKIAPHHFHTLDIEKSGPGEQRLWCAVFLQIVQDRRSRSKKIPEIIAREEALQWVKKAGRDLEMVCDLAGITVEYAKKVLLQSEEMDFNVKTGKKKNIGGGRKP